MKAAHSAEMVKMNLNDAIALLKSKLSEATQAKSLEADKKYLVSLNTECQAKSEEWQARKESAAGELKAISKATEILSKGVSAAFLQVNTPWESSAKAAKRTQLTSLLR